MFKRFLLLILFTASIHASNISSVPLEHPIYPFFDRLETMGLIDELLMGTKPITRDRVTTILLHLDSIRIEMTSIDQQKLNNFLLDFRYEINSKDRYKEMHDIPNKHLHILRGLQNLADGEMEWLGKIPHEALIEIRKWILNGTQ